MTYAEAAIEALTMSSTELTNSMPNCTMCRRSKPIIYFQKPNSSRLFRCCSDCRSRRVRSYHGNRQPLMEWVSTPVDELQTRDTLENQLPQTSPLSEILNYSMPTTDHVQTRQERLPECKDSKIDAPENSDYSPLLHTSGLSYTECSSCRALQFTNPKRSRGDSAFFGCCSNRKIRFDTVPQNPSELLSPRYRE